MAGGFPIAQASGDLLRQTVFWLVVTTIAVIALGVVLFWARKYSQRSVQGGPEHSGPLSIERLEKMHRDGLISREEFSTLRRAALGLGPPAAKAGPGLTQPPGNVDDGKNREATEGPPSAEPPRG